MGVNNIRVSPAECMVSFSRAHEHYTPEAAAAAVYSG